MTRLAEWSSKVGRGLILGWLDLSVGICSSVWVSRSCRCHLSVQSAIGRASGNDKWRSLRASHVIPRTLSQVLHRRRSSSKAPRLTFSPESKCCTLLCTLHIPLRPPHSTQRRVARARPAPAPEQVLDDVRQVPPHIPVWDHLREQARQPVCSNMRAARETPSTRSTYVPPSRAVLGVVAVAADHKVGQQSKEAPASQKGGERLALLRTERTAPQAAETPPAPTNWAGSETATDSVKNQLKNPMLSFFFFSGSLGGGVVLSSLSPLLSPSVGGGGGGESLLVEQAAAVAHLSESLPVAAS